jgi:hypothetical protein
MKFLLLSLLLLSQLFAAQAYGKLRVFQNGDGTTFKGKAYGNQHLNWIETQDGEIVKRNPLSRNFEYAHIKNNRMQASGVRYEKNNSNRARALGHISKLKHTDINKLWKEKQKASLERKKPHE